MVRTRIYIDSVLDRDTVRVLISTDGKTETPVIMEMAALEKLLEEKNEFWRTVEVRRKGQTRKLRVLKRDIEGEAITFDRTETPFFEKLVKDHGGRFSLTDEGDVRRVKKGRIKDGLKKPSRSRGTLRQKLERRKKTLRRRRRVNR